MTAPHPDDLTDLGANSDGGPSRRDQWHRPEQAEVILPSAYSLAAVLVMGLFALSLSVGGLIHLIFSVRRKGK